MLLCLEEIEPGRQEAEVQGAAADEVQVEIREEEAEWVVIGQEPVPAANVSVQIVEADYPIKLERHVTA